MREGWRGVIFPLPQSLTFHIMEGAEGEMVAGVFLTCGMGNGHRLPSGSETLDIGIIWSPPKLFSSLTPTGLMKDSVNT